MYFQKIKQSIKKNIKEFVFVLGIIGVLALAFYKSGMKCLFKYTVGFPCPGCGLTRAWLSFLRMDFEAAFKWHPLFWIVPVIIVIEVFMKEGLFKSKRSNLAFWIILSLMILGVYVVRMINLFPNEAPMDYNKESLAYKWITSKTVQ